MTKIQALLGPAAYAVCAYAGHVELPMTPAFGKKGNPVLYRADESQIGIISYAAGGGVDVSLPDGGLDEDAQLEDLRSCTTAKGEPDLVFTTAQIKAFEKITVEDGCGGTMSWKDQGNIPKRDVTPPPSKPSRTSKELTVPVAEEMALIESLSAEDHAEVAELMAATECEFAMLFADIDADLKECDQGIQNLLCIIPKKGELVERQMTNKVMTEHAAAQRQATDACKRASEQYRREQRAKQEQRRLRRAQRRQHQDEIRLQQRGPSAKSPGFY